MDRELSPTRLARDRDSAVVSFDNSGHNCEPETGAACRRVRRPHPAGISPGKPLEDAMRHFWRDTGSVVGHGDNSLRPED
jgi:hypothetical protein